MSPVPGFRKWLDGRVAAKDQSLFGRHERAKLCQEAEAKDPCDALAQLMLRGFVAEAQPPESVRATLMHLCARYLAAEKEGPPELARPLDPVARFHLGNGARLERINWLGDISEKGLREAHGLMVNYRYDLKEIERNHEAYANDGEVTASRAVRQMAKPPTNGKPKLPATKALLQLPSRSRAPDKAPAASEKDGKKGT